MPYLFHLQPLDMRGRVLMPLNQLKLLLPQVYEREVRKYAGRQLTLEYELPIGDGCRWGDVLFLTAVDPREVFQAYDQAGLIRQQRPRACYVIRPERLAPQHTAVMTWEDGDRRFSAYDPLHLDDYAVLPQATRDYYARQYERGRPALLFQGVPHVLYRGTLDVSNTPLIKIP